MVSSPHSGDLKCLSLLNTLDFIHLVLSVMIHLAGQMGEVNRPHIWVDLWQCDTKWRVSMLEVMPWNETLIMKAMFVVHELRRKWMTVNIIHWPNLNHVSHICNHENPVAILEIHWWVTLFILNWNSASYKWLGGEIIPCLYYKGLTMMNLYQGCRYGLKVDKNKCLKWNVSWRDKTHQERTKLSLQWILKCLMSGDE